MHANKEPEVFLRKYTFTQGYLKNPYSSVLISAGGTRVVVSLSIEMKTPAHAGSDSGWLTAEYSLMPGSTGTRASRERSRISGRTAEIQRIIGRSLRMAVDLKKMPGISMLIDCDVLDADGGTRTASINGGMIAVAIACRKLVVEGVLKESPLKRWIGAISAGAVDGKIVADLNYELDSRADADFNFVFCENGNIIEIQGTSERDTVPVERFMELLDISRECVMSLIGEMKTTAGF